jgi:hypothetical protein
MNMLDKIILFLSAILCGHCRKELKSQKKITLRVYADINQTVNPKDLIGFIRFCDNNTA